jgi:hypothetical protein
VQTTSALYRQILATEPHWFETSIVIGESGDLVTEYGDRILFGGTAILVARSGADSGFTENQIFNVRTSIQMFQEDPTIGGAISQEIELTMLKPSGDIPPMGLIVPYVRVCSELGKSEWIQQGVFQIDTREVSDNDGNITTITIHGYDAMLTAEQYWHDNGSLNWSSGTVTDRAMVGNIAAIMGISVDSRTYTIMTNNYRIPMPMQYTLREILGYIASMYAGCFIITEVGQLRLVSLLELPPETNLLIDNVGDYIVFGSDRIKV